MISERIQALIDLTILLLTFPLVLAVYIVAYVGGGIVTAARLGYMRGK